MFTFLLLFYFFLPYDFFCLFECFEISLGTRVIVEYLFAMAGSLTLTELLEVLVMALKVLLKEVKPLEIKVSWAKTKVWEFGDETAVCSCVW